MRRIVPLLLVAVIAFAVGTAGANGTLSRLLADTRVGGAQAATATAPTGATPMHGAATTVASATTPSTTAGASQASSTAAPGASATPRPTQTPTIPAALSLAQKTAGGAALDVAGWVGAAGVTVQVMAPPSYKGALRAEVEAQSLGHAFTGKPTAAATVVNGIATIPLHSLAAGRYRWQARLTAAHRGSRWSPFAQAGDAFNVQVAPPVAPRVASPSDPTPGTTYATATISFTWQTPGDPAGIAGYSYRLDTDPHGAAHAAVRTQAQQVSLGGLGTGTYYFHVRAVDKAGNWGPSTTFPVHVDVTPPQLTSRTFSTFVFNPQMESLKLAYQLSKISHVTVGIYDTAGTRVRHIVVPTLQLANVPLSVSWDGRDDAGHLVPAGSYSFYLRATDRIGNANVMGWNGFAVTDKRIVVSLSQQRMWAYQGDKVILTTLVTTGNQALPTPTGRFSIMFTRHPFTFHSPWPKGSKYWYADSPVNYALYFHDYGFWIHDAPWRTTYGPGSNSGVGTPGQNYTGTHGCINVPEDAMAQLYNWAVPGTGVEINP